MRKKTKSFILIFAIIILGCKDEFLIETTNYKPIMVVDGMITNEPGPYTIKLSLASPLPLEEKIHLEACTVILNENTDKSEVLTETEPGIYVTSIDGIQGIVGNNYSISILTPEGKEYYTEPQKMKVPIEIDSIYAELSYHEHEDYPLGLPGYQFYTDSKMASTQDNYFLWNMIETYKYIADYRLYALFDGFVTIPGKLTDYENLYTCWKTQNVNYFFTAKTSNLSVPQISHQPLHFVGTDSRRLQERYSLFLKQYTIGEETYYFWKGIADQSTEENFLVANQPYNIIGNIKNINNPNQTVHGNFTVASVSQKRIFFDRPNVAFYYNPCEVEYKIEEYIKFYHPPFYYVLTEIGLGIVQEWCVDCTFDDGEAFKPAFWIDK
ncbi:MAG: DUF4249 family protein [Bacteroidales bacterium]|nr:DUF4249 family protein [Bacteroidales bacterium]